MSGKEHPETVDHPLLGAAPAGLSEWYATPMTHRTAELLLAAARQQVQQHLRDGTPGFQPSLLVLVSQWWLRPEVRSLFEELRHAMLSPHEHALLHLVYGQLLASRKLEPARDHLTAGFRLAAALLASADYFRLLRRHEMLAMLTYGKSPSAASDLPELLAEAAVIERLQRGNRQGIPEHGHNDTLG